LGTSIRAVWAFSAVAPILDLRFAVKKVPKSAKMMAKISKIFFISQKFKRNCDESQK
jgi:hypothetical protein